MKNNIRLLFAAAALCAAGLAQAALDRIEEAYEVDLANVTLPGYENGQVLLRPCDDCDRVALKVDAGTRYLVDGTDEAMTLKEFQFAASTVVNRYDGLVTVIFDTSSLAVKRLILNAPGL